VSETGERLTYYLYLPSRVVEEKLPIVTVLHGSSGSGPGDGKALDGGHRFATQLWVRDAVQAKHPGIVLVPQADPPPGETWVRAWRAPSPQDRRPKEALVLVMEVLAALQRDYPVDPRRLYLTGQSMGGFGAWLAYTRYPGLFAAIVPVCGGGEPAAVIPNATAVWAFHGDRDTVVPVGRAREMVAAIEAAGAPIRYTEYPGQGHNIFAEAYGEPELADWLFSQALPVNSNP
jgi:predicted peptidase